MWSWRNSQDIKNILDSTCTNKMTSVQFKKFRLSRTFWECYSSFESGIDALKSLGWTLENQLKNEEAKNIYEENDNSIKSFSCYTIPRDDHFVF